MITLRTEDIEATFCALGHALTLIEHIHELDCEDDFVVGAMFDLVDDIFHKSMRVLSHHQLSPTDQAVFQIYVQRYQLAMQVSSRESRLLRQALHGPKRALN